MSDKVKVVIVPDQIDEQPFVWKIGDNLDDIKNVIKGEPRLVKMALNDTIIILNKNGDELKLPLNILGIHGTFIIANVKEEVLTDLSEFEIKLLMKVLIEEKRKGV